MKTLMHKLPLILVPIIIATTAAGAAEPNRYDQLGTCLAFYAIEGGIDGKKDLASKVSKSLAAIGAEYMFEASLLKKTDDEAHTYVVRRLVELNIIANEEGSKALEAKYGDDCAVVSKNLTEVK